MKSQPTKSHEDREVGTAPKKGWKIATIGESFITATGNTPPKNNPKFYGGVLPLVKPPELRDARFEFADDGLSEAGAEVSRTIPAKSVLVSCIGNLGKIGLNTVPVAFNQQINAILPDENKAIPEFIFYQALSSGFKDQLERLASGTTVPIVNKSKFNSIKIVLPPLPEQKQIVELLDEVDALRKLRAEADRRTAALIPALFHEMFGVPFSNSVTYQVKKLGELIRAGDKMNYGVVQPGDEVSDGIPIVRAGDFNGTSIDKEHLKRISPEIEKKYSRSRLRGDEILISCVGSIGCVALADLSLAGFNIVRAVARVPLRDEIDRLFVASQLMTQSFRIFFAKKREPWLNRL